MKPPFCRSGNKTPLLKQIDSIIPVHKIFVEPFVGSGAVYFNRPLIAEKAVINDLDKDLITGYRLLKKGVKGKPLPKTLEEKRAYYAKPANTDTDKLLHLILKFCNTFSNVGKGDLFNNPSHEKKIADFPVYTEYLKDTTILNEDYKKVIKKYDSKDTFFFLDPPYEDSKKKNLYETNANLNYEELLDAVKGIKGMFLLTLNDSKYIRDLFKDYIIEPVNIRGNNPAVRRVGSKDRKELFIRNYKSN
jgi:DNA adenine methylase